MTTTVTITVGDTAGLATAGPPTANSGATTTDQDGPPPTLEPGAGEGTIGADTSALGPAPGPEEVADLGGLADLEDAGTSSPETGPPPEVDPEAADEEGQHVDEAPPPAPLEDVEN